MGETRHDVCRGNRGGQPWNVKVASMCGLQCGPVRERDCDGVCVHPEIDDWCSLHHEVACGTRVADGMLFVAAGCSVGCHVGPVVGGVVIVIVLVVGIVVCQYSKRIVSWSSSGDHR